MERDGSRVYVPEEFELWLERSLITREQYESLKRGYVSDIWRAIEYFHQEGMINDLQFERLRLRYIPKEIQRWYELGIIDATQYNVLKQGYDKPPLELIEELRARGILNKDQAIELSTLYEFAGPEGPSLDEVSFEPEPPSLHEDEEEVYDWTDEDLKVLLKKLGKGPAKETGKKVEGWPEEMEYHFEMEVPPPRASAQREESREEKKIEEEKERRAPPIKERPSRAREEVPKPKERLAEVQKESFFKFNQLVFFITGSILFLLAVFATIAYTWEMLSNLGRGLVFIGLSCLVAASGLIMRFRDFNKYLEVITYHASIILFAVGIVFLISGSLNIEGLKQGVIILSLLIPIMVLVVGFHFNYRSIPLVATLGYIFASINSFIMWPEGSIVSNLALLPVSMLLLFAVRKGKGGSKTRSMIGAPRGYAERGPIDLAFIYTWITLSALFFLIAQTLSVEVAGQGTMPAWMLTVSGLILLGVLFAFGYIAKDPGIQTVAFLALLIDGAVQVSEVQGYGLSGGSWAAISLALPFFLLAFILGKSRSEENDRWVYDIMLWVSAVTLTLSIIGTSTLSIWDIHTHYSALFGIFSTTALIMSFAYKRKDMAVYGSIVLACTVSYFSLLKFEAASFLVLGIPFLMALIIGKEETRKNLEIPFLILIGINYAFLWVGPLKPFGAIENALEPGMDWWKGGITLLYSLIVFYWGLGGGYKLRMALGAVIYLVSTWMAMWGQGDLFILVFFLLTVGPALLRRSAFMRDRMDLSVKAENTFQNLLLGAGAVLFASLWICPIFTPLEDAGLDWAWWKSAVALAFSLIYLSWSIISVRRFHFLTGSVFYISVIMFNVVYRSELFALGLIALPLLVLVVERMKRTARDITKLDVQVYMLLLSFVLIGAFFCILAIKPVEPLVDLGYGSWRTLAWWRTAISMGLTGTVLLWGLLHRSHYYYFLGTCFLSVNAILLAVTFSELFVLVPLAVPVILFMKEFLSGELGRKRTFRSYLKADPRPEDDGPEEVVPTPPPPMYWLYGHLFPFILLPLSFSLLVPTVYPLFESPLHPVYWKYLVLAALCTPVFICSIRSRLPTAIGFASALFSIGTVIASLYKLELLAFTLLIPPVLYRVVPRSRRIDVKDGRDIFGKVFHLAYIPAVIAGYLLLWVIPFEAEIDLGLGTTSYLVFKGVVTLVYGIVLASWAIYRENRTYLIIGVVMVQLSIMFLGVCFFEPILLLVLVIPLFLDRLVGKKGLISRGPEFSDFLRFARPLFLISVVGGFGLIYLKTYDPVLDIWDAGRLLWIYKSSVLMAYSLLFLLTGYLYRKDPADGLVGTFLVSAGIFTICILLFSPAFFLFLPLLYLMGHHRLLDRIEDMPSRKFLMGLYKGLILPISIGFPLIWVVPVYSLIPVTLNTTGYWTITCSTGVLFSVLLYLWGLRRREDIYIISSLVFLPLSLIVLSRTLLPFVIVSVLFVPVLIDVARRVMKGPVGPEETEGSTLDIYYRIFLLVPVIGFITLWFPPSRPMISLEEWSVGYWAVKGVLGAVFSFAFFCWGIYKRDVISIILSLVMVMITAIALAASIMPAFTLGVLSVPILADAARRRFSGEDEEASKGAAALRIFQSLYIFAVFAGFALCWPPSAHDILGLGPWSVGHLIFSSTLALVYVGIMTFTSVRGDRPYEFLGANVLLLVTAFVMGLTLSEPFALLAFLVPLLHFLSRDFANTEKFKEAAGSIARSFFPGDIRDPDQERTSEPVRTGSFYDTFKHAFLVVSLMFFGLLFMMVWSRPLVTLIEMNAHQHLWFIVITMFAFGMLPILWGLKGILRAHVLFGVLYVVVDSWVLFLNQIKGLGVVVSLFFTAIMFIAAGMFFVWASKKQKMLDEKAPVKK